jgi:hypothetical protein
MNTFIQQIVNEILTEQSTAKNVVAIYPGRFQPMGAHHAKVFKWAQSKFGKNNTFISTSTKVERPKSPLSFSEKEMVIKKNGFTNIIQINAMYNGEEYFKKLSKFKPTETALIMIVGEKDGERLSPKYYKKLSQSDDVSDLKPYLHTDENGKEAKLIYWMAAPHISLNVCGFGEMCGTTIRRALGQKSDNKEKLFKDIMGFYDKKVYDTIVPKFEDLFESISENHMGYPSAEQYKEIERSRKEMRVKLDDMAVGDQYYESVEIIPNSLNIPRSKMPQIKSNDVRDFIQFLTNKGISVSSKPVSVKNIKMTQRDINKDKVNSLIQSDKSSLSKPVIISSDGYILDGHHRVLALYNMDRNFKLKTIHVDIPIQKLLNISHEYPKSFTKNITEINYVLKESPFKLLKGFTFLAKKSFGSIQKGIKYVIAGIDGNIGNLTIALKKVGSSDVLNVKVRSVEEFYSNLMLETQIAKFMKLNEYTKGQLFAGKIKIEGNPVDVEVELIGADNKKKVFITKVIHIDKKYYSKLPKNGILEIPARIFRTPGGGWRKIKTASAFESIKEASGIGGVGAGNNSARWTAPKQSKKMNIAQLSGYDQIDFPIADELDISNEKFGYVSSSKSKKYNNKVRAVRSSDGSLVFEDITTGLVSSGVDDVEESLFGGDGGMKPHDKLLMGALTSFMKNTLNFSAKVTVKKKSSNSLFGDLILNSSAMSGKITLHYNPNASYEMMLKSLIHELIHAKQVVKGELKPSDDWKELVWKGKSIISVKDYNKFQQKDINQYKNLPWEKEAYGGMDKYYRMFLKSKEFNNLTDKDPNLDYIISNLSELHMGYTDQKWIDNQYNPIDEDITLDVNIGDTILMGKFKNKKTVVKSIGVDDHGMPTINGKKVVTFRKMKSESVLTEGEYLDDDRGLVKCAECNEWMGQIQYRHLKYKHNMTMDEYKSKYPNLPLISESIKNTGTKNPMSNDSVRQKHKESVTTDEYRKLQKKLSTGRNHTDESKLKMALNNPMNDYDNRIKVSNGVKKSYENNENLRKTRSEIGKKYGFGTDTFRNNMIESGRWRDTNEIEDFERYRNKVRLLTKESYRKYFYEIPNANKRGYDWHLDHKYSILNGFKNNIPKEVIAHYSNLEVIPYNENISKHSKNSINLNELIVSIQNSKDVIDNRVLLTCGGAAGHMMHLSDDLDLTFGELKKIVTDVLQGNIKTVTEKLDGQNLMMSWKGGKAIFARNKGHIKGFGTSAMDALGVKQMFSGRGDLEEAFYTAAFDLQNAISKLSQKQRDKIFGEGSKWMNFEVMYPATTNVIPYNHTFLVFHGTVEYDESGNPIGGKGEDANILAGMIKQVNAHLQSKYEIRGPVKLTITPTQDFSKSQSKYLSQIKKIQSEFGLKDSDKVGMYHYKYWETFIDKKSPTKLDDVTRNGLVLRWAYDDKSFRLDKNTLPDVKTLEWAKGIDKGDLVKLRGENMHKFDVIFLQLGAEVLKNMSGFLAANPDTAVQTLRKEMESAIPKLLASDDPKMIEFATRHLQRLEKMGGLEKLVPTEGIVFNYNGKIYKMVGLFAPINQILGAFRYGR